MKSYEMSLLGAGSTHTGRQLDHLVPRLVMWSLLSPSACHLTLTASKCARGLAIYHAITDEAIGRGKVMK